MPKSIVTDANVQNRFRVIWSLLVWEGAIRNATLAELFGVGSMQVSRIIAEFRDCFPDAIERDKYQWISTGRVKAPDGAGSLRQYLTLRTTPSIEHGTVFDARLVFLEPDPATFRALHRAATEKLPVSIDYASMSSGATTTRVVFPQTLVQLGLRWHVRAWCTVRQQFRDFNLGRMSNVKLLTDSEGLTLPADIDWITVLVVRIGAHQDLGLAQERIVRDEYFRGTMGVRAEVRAALLKYWLQEARVAVDVTVQKPPAFILQLREPEKFRRYLLSE